MHCIFFKVRTEILSPLYVSLKLNNDIRLSLFMLNLVFKDLLGICV